MHKWISICIKQLTWWIYLCFTDEKWWGNERFILTNFDFELKISGPQWLPTKFASDFHIVTQMWAGIGIVFEKTWNFTCWINCYCCTVSADNNQWCKKIKSYLSKHEKSRLVFIIHPLVLFEPLGNLSE